MNLLPTVFYFLMGFGSPCFLLYSQVRDPDFLTLAFYNVENLFDTLDNPETRDEDFTPSGKFRYRALDYREKLKNLSLAISGIGRPKDQDGPELVGLAEVENRSVLEDMLMQKHLADKGFQIVHEDSEDQRGIDVALLYRDAYFQPLSYAYHKVSLWDREGRPIRTRDVLHVHGLLMGEEIHVLVNHWPSRRGGALNSAPRRKKAAYVNRQIIAKIRVEDELARIVVMGDFNDDPSDESIRHGLVGQDGPGTESIKLLNPMEAMYKKGWNSMVYRDRLHLFDQVLISESLLDSYKADWHYFNAGIYKPTFLITNRGKYLGYPRRGFSNGRFNGGFSDHFPVYLQLRRR